MIWICILIGLVTIFMILKIIIEFTDIIIILQDQKLKKLKVGQAGQKKQKEMMQELIANPPPPPPPRHPNGKGSKT